MIKALDSFRFYAFLAVFFFHIRLLNGGYLGVQAFFVLSGFLLTPILVEMKGSMPLKQYLISFYGRRALRIFPLYYLYLLAIGLIALVAMLVFGNHVSVALNRAFVQLPYAVTYTYDFYHASAAFKHSPLLTHFWSLAVEEQFYLIWPVFIWFCSNDKLKVRLAMIVLAGPVIRMATYVLCRWHSSSWLGNDPLLVVYVLPLSHFDAFAVGGLAALMRPMRWKQVAWLATVVALVFGLGSQYLVSGNIDWNSLGYPQYMQGELKAVWGYSMVNLMFASVLCAVKAGTFAQPLFCVPFIQYLGKISYGLYVYHFPIIWLLNHYCAGSINRVLLYIVMFAATVLLSALSYELFEKRFIMMKDILFSKCGNAVTAVPADGDLLKTASKGESAIAP